MGRLLLILISYLFISKFSFNFADETYIIPPFKFAEFCHRYPSECIVTKGKKIIWNYKTKKYFSELNIRVNKQIIEIPSEIPLENEIWLLFPKEGQCHDYVVSKRHELIKTGYSSSDLLLAEVITQNDLHHLVLIIKTDKGDFIMDSLRNDVYPIELMEYRLLRMQSSENPNYWVKNTA